MFRRVSIRIGLLAGDISVILLALFIAGWLRLQLDLGKPLVYVDLGWIVYIMAAATWGSSFFLLDVYNLQKNLRVATELQRLFLAHTATTLAFAGALYFSFRDISRLQVIYFSLVGLLFLIIFRLIFRLVLNTFGDKRYGTRRVLIVGAGTVGKDVAQMVTKHHWTGLRLIGFLDDNPDANTGQLPHLGPLIQTLPTVHAHHITEVIFALPRYAHAKLANLVAELQALRINVRVVPDFFDLVFLRSAVEDFGGMPLVTLKEPALDPLQRLTKRIFDICVGVVMLIIALPVMSILAVAIKLDSSGPIIFRQERIGENGRIFKMYKFRSMVKDAETRQQEVIQTTADNKIIHKSDNDPRITRIGHFLRRTSLDELPQLFNILKGDMSLVGPRPELPWLVDKYESWQRKRFEVPQGLTGWWQVNGRSDKPMHLHTEDDLYYIKHYSLWFDLEILWRTVITVINRRGAF